MYKRQELNSYFSNPDKEIISYTELLHEFTAEINEEKGDKDVTCLLYTSRCV